MDAVSELRQGPLAVVNYTITAANANLTAVKNLRIKGKLEQAKPTHCSENPLTSWSTKP